MGEKQEEGRSDEDEEGWKSMREGGMGESMGKGDVGKDHEKQRTQRLGDDESRGQTFGS